MTSIYYIDADGTARDADLSIIDPRTGTRCEIDILGNMGITSSGTGVHRVPQDDDECDDELQRAALQAQATFYADDAEAAQWWVDYVHGYTATQADVQEIKNELNELDAQVLRAITIDFLGNDLAHPGRSFSDDELVYALVNALHDGANDYEDERRVFTKNLENLRAALARVLDA